MAVVIKGKNYLINDVPQMEDKLPVGNYVLDFNAREGYFFLEKIKAYKTPAKLYGDFHEIEIYLKSFKNSKSNVGVLLQGIKGTGKTELAKLLANEMNALGKPVINIVKGFHGVAFTKFLSRPELGEAMIFIDEFEKQYPKPQETPEILSLMSGQYDTRHLYVLTSNSPVDTLLTNRPGRIEYLKEYKSLTDQQITEVVEDLLKDQKKADELYQQLDSLAAVTYDILICIIRNMNLHKFTANKALSYLNIFPTKANYKFTYTYGKSVHNWSTDKKGKDKLTIRKTPTETTATRFINLFDFHTVFDIEGMSNAKVDKIKKVSEGVYNVTVVSPIGNKLKTVVRVNR